MHDHEVMEIVDAVTAHQQSHGLPALVHVRLRKCEDHASRIDTRVRDQ